MLSERPSFFKVDYREEMRRLPSTLLVAVALCAAGARGQAQSDPGGTFTLEIPALNVRVPGDGTAVLPPGDPTNFQIRIKVPASQVGYRNIFARINTDSANPVMTTSATLDGINCEFDLARRQGFRFRSGRNSVEIAVEDLRGRFRYASFLLEASPPAADTRGALPIVAPTGDRHALILGIARYRAAAAGVKNLPFVDYDAAAMREFLVSAEGGYRAEHVQLVLNEDATLTRIRQALADTAARVGPDDLVTVYLAGHGVADPDDPRRNYLLAHDSRPDALAESALPFAELEDFFGRALKAKSVVTIVDVAHAGALARATPGANNLLNQYVSRYAAGGARVALAAADVGQSNWESDSASGRSVFARFLVQGLRSDADANRDGTVTFGELKTYVRDQVRRATGGQQSPVGSQNEGDALALAGLRARVSK